MHGVLAIETVALVVSCYYYDGVGLVVVVLVAVKGQGFVPPDSLYKGSLDC